MTPARAALAEAVALLVDLRANLEVCNAEERGGLTPLLAAVQYAQSRAKLALSPLMCTSSSHHQPGS